MCCHHHHDDESDLDSNHGNDAVFVHLIAGSIAGIMEHVSIFPIDTIKVKVSNFRPICSQPNKF